MTIKEELASIVGAENVSNADAVLLKYSRDHSLVPAGSPECVVWPTGSEQVGEVLKWANTKNMPVVPVSSQEHFNGGAVPRQGGIILDLSKMNRIFEIDKDLKKTRFEAGVTWARSEGFISAPETSHAIAQTIREAKRAKEEGRQKTILMNWSGHGLMDLKGYEAFFDGNLKDYPLPDELLEKSEHSMDGLPMP